MKPIPKSNRESNRYVVVTITSNSPISKEQFSNSLESTALEMVGKLGIGSLGLQVVSEQYSYPSAVIKTIAGKEKILRAIICAMTCAQTTDGNKIPLKVESTKTSGTITHVKVVSNSKQRKNKVSVKNTIKNKVK